MSIRYQSGSMCASANLAVFTQAVSVRLRRYAMPFGDIFETNILNIGILLPIVLTYSGESVLKQVGGFTVVA